MPDGAKVISFDKFGKENGNIVADSAVQLENENITKFFKNVVVTNSDGSTFKSEELIWDQPKKIFYCNKPFEMLTQDGQVIRGINFKSDDKLNNATWDNGTGEFDVTESEMQ